MIEHTAIGAQLVFGEVVPEGIKHDVGYYGMGDKEKALKYLAEVEALDNNHQGILQFRSLITLVRIV